MSFITKKWGLKCRIKKLFYKIYYKNQVKLHNSVTFRDSFKILPTKESRITIGKGTFFNNYCSIASQGEIIIGEYCLFGEGVKIYDHNHIFKNMPELIIDQGFKVGKVNIGNNCWIGSNVIILNGVRVGNNCVIGAGCIIDKDIPNNSILRHDGTLSKIRSKNK